MNKFKAWLGRVMAGRYGTDDLNKLLLGICWVLVLVNLFVRGIAGYIVGGAAFAVLALLILRTFSRNIQRRYAENVKYTAIRSRIFTWLRQRKLRFERRKEFRYFDCPGCGVTNRVPRGKGRIEITCPKCGKQFERKS